jgi:hypothetical protein
VGFSIHGEFLRSGFWLIMQLAYFYGWNLHLILLSFALFSGFFCYQRVKIVEKSGPLLREF